MRRALAMLVMGLAMVVPTGATAQSTTFGDGQYVVGTDIAPGYYRGDGGESCYWARLSGFSGTTDEILANGTPTAAVVLRILDTDAGFETQGCGEWSSDAAIATTAPTGYSTLGDVFELMLAHADDFIALTQGTSGGPAALQRRVSGMATRLEEGLKGINPHPCYVAGYARLWENVGALKLWATMLEERPRQAVVVYSDEDILMFFLAAPQAFSASDCPPDINVR